jgi:pantoate--beta-alanine ligase
VQVLEDPYQFQAYCASLDASHALGFIPTMGAIHEGHLSLVRASRRQDEVTAVSIFVNPTQFGPSEDLANYPRHLEQDLALLEKEGVQVVFTPTPEGMYPNGVATFVDVADLGQRLCGASRPGHFRGVATVVFKLFQLAAPTRAYFGQKDAAQVAVVRRMIHDLFLPVELVVGPIVRERDGLALSSRNAYLSPAERHSARIISRALRIIGEAFDSGERSTPRLLMKGTEVIENEPGLRLDYLTAVDGDTLLPVAEAVPGTLIAVAALVGSTRLIDNARVDHDDLYLL